jgi:ABC-type nitrate/sulfonate/bicarbonate transport system permease component
MTHYSQLITRLSRLIPPLFILILCIVAWQVYVVVAGIPDFILPAPSGVWQSFLDQHDLLLQNTWPTVQIALGGYILALALGLLLAIAIRSSRWLELSLYPLLITSQAVPLVALAPILVIVFGFDLLPKLIIVCLICFFPITVNAVDGFKSVDPDLISLLRTLGAGRWRLFREVEWPAALPLIFSGARIAITYSVVGAIFAEWSGASEGLGWLLQQERSQFETGVVFADTAILAILGILLFASVALLERLLLPWYHSDQRRGALMKRGQ